MKPSTIVLAGCALFVACGVAQTALQQNALLAVMVGGVIAELGGGKIGVAWNDPLAPVATSRQNVQRALIGLALGALVGGVALGIGFASRSLQHDAHGQPLLVPVALGLLESFFVAIQVEILQRGVLRVFCTKVEPRAFVPAAVVVGTVAAAGHEGTTAAGYVAAAALALALALLWQRTRSALLPVFVHTGLRFVLLVLAAGSGFGLVGRGAVAGTPLTAGLACALACVALAAATRFGPFAARSDASVV